MLEVTEGWATLMEPKVKEEEWTIKEGKCDTSMKEFEDTLEQPPEKSWFDGVTQSRLVDLRVEKVLWLQELELVICYLGGYDSLVIH